MDNTVRTTTSGQFFAPSPLLPNEVRLYMTNGANSDEIVTYTDPQATAGFDPAVDAVKMAAGSTVNIGYHIQGQDYAINVMDSLDAQTVLPLYVSASDTGSYTLVATLLNTPGLTAYLKDSALNTLTDLATDTVHLTLNGGQLYTGYSVIFKANPNTTGIASISSASTHIYSYGDRVYVNRPSSDAASISVTNLLGQDVAQVSSNSQETDFALPAIQPWYAIVKVTEGEKVTVAKVLISNK